MSSRIKSIAVFCGASLGAHPDYAEAAMSLGKLLGERGITLIYGGARLGLMGQLADAVLANGGQVVGVIPQSLMNLEVAHAGLTELQVVTTLAERKELMMRRADAFIVMPGGLGTLDELFEVWTANQLHLLSKPIGLLNTQRYFDQLLSFLDHAVAEQFLRAQYRSLLQVHDQPLQLLDLLQSTDQ